MEVNLEQVYPDEIHFVNEKGVKVTQNVQYEYNPIICGGLWRDWA